MGDVGAVLVVDHANQADSHINELLFVITKRTRKVSIGLQTSEFMHHRFQLEHSISAFS